LAGRLLLGNDTLAADDGGGDDHQDSDSIVEFSESPMAIEYPTVTVAVKLVVDVCVG
jgi:hypothetical protein